MSDGAVNCIFGSPGSGKTWFATRTMAPDFCGPGRIVVYSTPSPRDAREWSLGPAVWTAREVYAQKTAPEAVLVRDRDQADELVEQCLAADPPYRVLYLVDEAHEVWPERATPREEVEELTKWRHFEGLELVAITQRPALISKTLVHVAEALGWIRFFRLKMPVDLEWIRRNYGAGAALDVARLAPHTSRELHKDKPTPPGWDGYLQGLERKVARERSFQELERRPRRRSR